MECEKSQLKHHLIDDVVGNAEYYKERLRMNISFKFILSRRYYCYYYYYYSSKE